MTKLIYLEITDCQKCPWCRYDPYWPDLADSGWYCYEPITALEHSYRLLMREQEAEEFDDPIPIPDWCPLPNRSDIVDLGSDIMSALIEPVK